MKKLLAIALLVAMLLTMGMFMTACGDEEPADDTPSVAAGDEYPDENGDDEYPADDEDPADEE